MLILQKSRLANLSEKPPALAISQITKRQWLLLSPVLKVHFVLWHPSSLDNCVSLWPPRDGSCTEGRKERKEVGGRQKERRPHLTTFILRKVSPAQCVQTASTFWLALFVVVFCILFWSQGSSSHFLFICVKNASEGARYVCCGQDVVATKVQEPLKCIKPGQIDAYSVTVFLTALSLNLQMWKFCLCFLKLC